MSDSVNVRVTGELKNHLQQQVGESGLYENASEYIRSLIRADLMSSKESWQWLKGQLEPSLRLAEEDFVSVSADDVISRNKV
ncbi:ribbon-helix-helix domain-containing protein [Kordiimonas pumila]|uniref:Type II toxin-antitoxin system ParD family antitoxin n=1 Tax=Kordiimonas pumila TaxID=2161677 RepID=A0ABV7D2Y2_9PROT|nr:transcriptional regulator [Kordiimonas pumila]